VGSSGSGRPSSTLRQRWCRQAGGGELKLGRHKGETRDPPASALTECPGRVDLALSSPLLLAAQSRSTIGNPGGYVTTCISASSTSGGGANPGDNFEVNFAAGSCTSDVFSGMGGSASAQHSPVAGDSITGGAVGSVSLGAIHLGSQYALQQGRNFRGSGDRWIQDKMTVNNAALDEQAGYMLFDLDVSGGLRPMAMPVRSVHVWRSSTTTVDGGAPG
jgi:hypothetical protein